MVAFLAPLFASAAATTATLTAAAPIIGSAISARNNARNNQRNISAQDRLNAQNIEESRRADLLNHTRTLEAESRDRARAIADRDEHRVYNDPAAARARAEAAGFHPLAVTDQSGAFVTAPTNVAPASAVVPRLGRAVTEAYTGWGESFSRVASLQMQKSQLEVENKRLDMAYKRQIQSPPKGGIYGRSTSRASSSDAVRTARAGGDAPPSLATGWLAPRSPQERIPYTSGPSITEVDNYITDYLGGPFAIYGEDGMSEDIWELAGLGLQVGLQVPVRAGKALGEFNDKRRMRLRFERSVRNQKRASTGRYQPQKNKPPRGYYGPAGSRTGF